MTSGLHENGGKIREGGMKQKSRSHLSVSGNYSQHNYGYVGQYYPSFTITVTDVTSLGLGSM
jgi:hypothetical protein